MMTRGDRGGQEDQNCHDQWSLRSGWSSVENWSCILGENVDARFECENHCITKKCSIAKTVLLKVTFAIRKDHTKGI